MAMATAAEQQQQQSGKKALSFCLSSASLTFVFCVLLSLSCLSLFLSLYTSLYVCVFICVCERGSVCVCEYSGVMRLKVLLRIAPLLSLAQPLFPSLPLPRSRCLSVAASAHLAWQCNLNSLITPKSAFG